MANHDPLVVAKSMTALRTRAGAAERCRKYISGQIKSENSREFWEQVLHHIEHTDFVPAKASPLTPQERFLGAFADSWVS